jgi:hypothetical protein
MIKGINEFLLEMDKRSYKDAEKYILKLGISTD